MAAVENYLEFGDVVSFFYRFRKTLKTFKIYLSREWQNMAAGGVFNWNLAILSAFSVGFEKL